MRSDPLRISSQLYPNSTVVCVTDQFTCERLILAGARLAEITKTNLLVLSVTSGDVAAINTGALEYLYQKSTESGAPMQLLQSTNPVKAIADFARTNKAEHVVLGMPGVNSTFVPQLRNKLHSVKIFHVTLEGELITPEDLEADTAAAK